MAADRARERGKDLFAYLADCLANQQPNSSRFQNAARALSFSNLPEAAERLGDDYAEEMREHLMRMGDLAVSCLERLATQGNIYAIEDLGTIGTPRAAKALVPLLWHDDDMISLPAAWQLTRLLSIEAVEDELRDVPLTEDQRKAPGLDWIWAPFGEPAESSLPSLTGRIGYLLTTFTEGMALSRLPKKSNELDQPDPRLLIPVLAAASGGSRQNVNWQYFFDHLPADMRDRLAERFVSIRNFDPKEWKNLFRPSDYEFKWSVHYWLILVLAIPFFVSSHYYMIIKIDFSANLVSAYNISIVFVFLLNFCFSFFFVFILPLKNLPDLGKISSFGLVNPFFYFFNDKKIKEDLKEAQPYIVAALLISALFLLSCVHAYISYLLFLMFVEWYLSSLICAFILFVQCFLISQGESRLQRAQNPLLGVLEPPKPRRTPRISSSWFGWLNGARFTMLGKKTG